jgi:hypothetical protein
MLTTLYFSLSLDIINLHQSFNRRLRKRPIVMNAEERFKLLTVTVTDSGEFIRDWEKVPVEFSC